jgi:hypothetical protein
LFFTPISPYPITTVPGSTPKMILEKVCKREAIFEQINQKTE